MARTSNSRRGRNFSAQELDILLSLVEERLPMGIEQWESLALEYNRRFGADRQRDFESLRLKFKTLKNKKKPTGDPDCPIEIKRAKRADRAIQQQMGVEDFEDDEDGEDENEEAEVEEATVGHEEEDEEGDEEESLAVMEATEQPDLLQQRRSGEGVVSDTLCSGDNSRTPRRPPTVPMAERTKRLPTHNGDRTQSRGGQSRTNVSSRSSSPSGVLRTGYTAAELLSRNQDSQSVHSSGGTSTTSTQKRRIDKCLDSLEFDQTTYPADGFDSFTRFMLMQQMNAERKSEERWQQERQWAIEREEMRREELREARIREERMELLREEREERRDKKQSEMLAILLASMHGNKTQN